MIFFSFLFLLVFSLSLFGIKKKYLKLWTTIFQWNMSNKYNLGIPGVAKTHIMIQIKWDMRKTPPCAEKTIFETIQNLSISDYYKSSFLHIKLHNSCLVKWDFTRWVLYFWWTFSCLNYIAKYFVRNPFRNSIMEVFAPTVPSGRLGALELKSSSGLDSWIVPALKTMSCSGLDLWIVPTRSLKNEEIGLVDCPHKESSKWRNVPDWTCWSSKNGRCPIRDF